MPYTLPLRDVRAALINCTGVNSPSSQSYPMAEKEHDEIFTHKQH